MTLLAVSSSKKAFFEDETKDPSLENRRNVAIFTSTKRNRYDAGDLCPWERRECCGERALPAVVPELRGHRGGLPFGHSVVSCPEIGLPEFWRIPPQTVFFK